MKNPLYVLLEHKEDNFLDESRMGYGEMKS